MLHCLQLPYEKCVITGNSRIKKINCIWNLSKLKFKAKTIIIEVKRKFKYGRHSIVFQSDTEQKHENSDIFEGIKCFYLGHVETIMMNLMLSLQDRQETAKQ